MSIRTLARTLATASLIASTGTALLGAVSTPAARAQQVDEAAIDALFDDIDPDGPGCAVGVVRDQTLAHAEGYGLANLDYGLPITPTSTFYLGSVSKQFTAAAIAHAARAGHLSLDDPIRKWLPELPEYRRPVTVRHLLHHTSGVRDYLGLWNLSGWRVDDVHSDEETLELLARQQAGNFPAGEEYLYSNGGYFLLSELIERATDLTLREYLHEHFFEPLGMERSHFGDDRVEVIDERVIGYRATDDGYEMFHPWNYDKVGAGGMYSSIEDLARWDRNWYTEEVGGPGFTEQLRERGVLSDGTAIDYAFGLSHGEYRGLETVAHGGALAGFRTHLMRFPTERTTVLVLCNFPTSDPGSRAERVADVVLAPELAPVAAEEDETESVPEAVELTGEELDAIAGHWRASMGIEVEIVREGSELFFIQSGNRSPVLIAAPDRILLTRSDVDMRLESLVDGRWQSMSVTQRGNAFTAERIAPGDGPADYGDLQGAYYSEELDVTYTIFMEDGQLMLETPPDRSSELRNMGEDRFVTPFSTLLLFERDEGGAVTGFTIDAGRVRGIAFERETDDR